MSKRTFGHYHSNFRSFANEFMVITFLVDPDDLFRFCHAGMLEVDTTMPVSSLFFVFLCL